MKLFSDSLIRHDIKHSGTALGRVLSRVFFFPDPRRCGSDQGRFGSYRPNIGVFRPEKGNRPIREIKKKNLKPKIPVDLIRCRRLHRLNPFLLLLLLFCFFVFFLLFFRNVAILFCFRFRLKFKDFSGPYRSVTHCSSSSSSPALTPFFFFLSEFCSVSFDKNNFF